MTDDLSAGEAYWRSLAILDDAKRVIHDQRYVINDLLHERDEDVQAIGGLIELLTGYRDDCCAVFDMESKRARRMTADDEGDPDVRRCDNCRRFDEVVDPAIKRLAEEGR